MQATMQRRAEEEVVGLTSWVAAAGQQQQGQGGGHTRPEAATPPPATLSPVEALSRTGAPATTIHVLPVATSAMAALSPLGFLNQGGSWSLLTPLEPLQCIRVQPSKSDRFSQTVPANPFQPTHLSQMSVPPPAPAFLKRAKEVGVRMQGATRVRVPRRHSLAGPLQAIVCLVN
jgi:hypothetical protein